MKIVISSGHGTHIRGASGKGCGSWGVDEVDTAIEVMNQVAAKLRASGETVITYTDTVSDTQSENLDRIVDFHNAQGAHDLDVSVHLNAYECTSSKKMGCEVLYITQEELARDISAAMADALDLPDRGPKYRGDLAFLNGTNEPAVLLELFFCDAKLDCDAWRANKDELASAIAGAIIGEPVEPTSPRPPEEGGEALFTANGTCSWFGGPNDDGVSPSEGLAFIYEGEEEEFAHLLLPNQPPGTTGLARRLDADRVFYIACRWDYAVTPKDMLRNQSLKALVRGNGREYYAYPADWGPHEEQTGRAADLSPALMRALFDTDDATDEEVEGKYPA